MNKEAAIAEALRLLDSFASVGAERFDITHTDIDGNKRGFRPGQSLEQASRSMPHLVESAARLQNNVIVRPRGSTAQLVQLDDLDGAALDRVRPAAFLTLTTSPGNHQAWVAIMPPAGEDFARRFKRGAGADVTASGATRVAGTANFKRKYEPEFPTVTILEATPGHTVTPAQLEAVGLVAPPEPARAQPAPPARASGRHPRTWPDYARCLEGAPLAHGGDRPDVSRCDFTWCMTAIDWGFGVEQTAARLLQHSTKARQEGESYALRTARRAEAAVGRRQEGSPKR